MKKVLLALVVVFSVSVVASSHAQVSQKSDLTALVLSSMLPGTGEWYNSDFQGAFPIAECIVGVICPCIQLSSIIDAVAGDRSQDNIRIDFWSRPANR